METIQSRENPQVKYLIKLLKNRRLRWEDRRFVAEGVKLSCEAASSGVEIQCVYATPDALTRYPESMQLFLDSGVNVVGITEEISRKIGDTSTPQGVYSLCTMLDNDRHAVKIDRDGRYLMLCNLQDPGNIGTVARTVEAMGLDGLILSGDCPDLYSSKVLRSTMGSAFRLPIMFSTDSFAVVEKARELGLGTYAAALLPGACSPREISTRGGCLVLIGNEGNGLPDELVQACEIPLMIPMPGRAESLNAGVAAGIIAWELARGFGE